MPCLAVLSYFDRNKANSKWHKACMGSRSLSSVNKEVRDARRLMSMTILDLRFSILVASFSLTFLIVLAYLHNCRQ
jgi:hypothetical protein